MAMVSMISMAPEHWEDVRRIHLEGIATGEATFETDSASDWEAWSAEHVEYGRLVAMG